MEVGTWLDIKDERENWCLAEVLELNTTTKSLLVSFDGWPHTYDEASFRTHVQTIPLDSPRLAPLRSFSRAYTGTLKKNSRSFEFRDPDIKAGLEAIRQLWEAKLDAYDWTQLVRGRIFVFVESLLTSCLGAKETLPKPQIESIVEVCDAYLQAYNRWLNKLPELAPMVGWTTTRWIVCARAAAVDVAFGGVEGGDSSGGTRVQPHLADDVQQQREGHADLACTAKH